MPALDRRGRARLRDRVPVGRPAGRGPLTAESWRGAVAKRVRELPWDAIVADARPFLESGEEMATKAEVLGLPGW